MKKLLITIFIVLIIISQSNSTITAENIDISRDSIELIKQDIIALFLLDHINKVLRDYYEITEEPMVYPYDVEIKKLERVSEFRGYEFSILLEVSPTIGAHIWIGRDQLLFEISPANPGLVKLIEHTNLEKYDLSEVW